MLSANDSRWDSLKGGYRTTFDPRPAIERLRACGDDSVVWAELWSEVHHQGDLGEASYVALVLLAQALRTSQLDVRQLLGLASTIEVERRRATNPPIPSWLEAEYQSAVYALGELGLTLLRQGGDRQQTRAALAFVALAAGDVRLGAIIWYHDDDTLLEDLNDRLSWSKLYRDDAK